MHTASVADNGDTVKWLWSLRRRQCHRDRAHALPAAVDGVRVDAGRLRDGVRFLRHRPGRASTATSPSARSSSRSCGPRAAARTSGRRLGQRRVHGHGRAAWPTTTACGPRSNGCTTTSGLSARHLTVSTVGIIPGIRTAHRAAFPVNLAVSLHAANDTLRDELVPINRRYPLADLVDACRDYVDAKGRRLSFEWALIDGINDRRSDAAELAGVARSLARPRQPHPAQPDARLPDAGSTPPAVRDVPRSGSSTRGSTPPSARTAARPSTPRVASCGPRQPDSDDGDPPLDQPEPAPDHGDRRIPAVLQRGVHVAPRERQRHLHRARGWRSSASSRAICSSSSSSCCWASVPPRAGYFIANEKKWGFRLGVVVAVVP